MEKQPAVYMMANKRNGVIYTGVTSGLVGRIYQHKQKIIKGFTEKYDCNLLVYFELHHTMEFAIRREKQIKAGARKDKVQLIEKMNPSWKDLYPTLI